MGYANVIRLMYHLRNTSQALQAVVLEDSHRWLGRMTSYAMFIRHNTATRQTLGFLHILDNMGCSTQLADEGRQRVQGWADLGRLGLSRVVHPRASSHEFCTLAKSCYGFCERVATDIAARALDIIYTTVPWRHHLRPHGCSKTALRIAGGSSSSVTCGSQAQSAP